MIKIKINKEKDLISYIEVKGHSGYDVAGRDIVCAGVSSIVITTVNAIMRYSSHAISYNQDEGLVCITVNKHDKVIDILLENCCSLLEELQNDYKEYVKIDE